MKNNKSKGILFVICLLSIISAIIFGIIDSVFFFIAEEDLQNKILNSKLFGHDENIAELLTGGISASLAILFSSVIKKIINIYIITIDNPFIDSIGVLFGTLIVIGIYSLIKKKSNTNQSTTPTSS